MTNPGIPRPLANEPGSSPRVAPPVPLATPASEPPLKDVLVELWQNLEKLVRQEVALARAEIDLEARKLKAKMSRVAIGAGLLVAGALALVAAVILLLDLVVAAWLAALITGAVAAGAGFALVRSNEPSAADVIPQRSINSLQKDLETFRKSTQ